MEIVLITGANRGIGFALAEALLAEGFIVAAGCRDPAAATNLEKLGQSHPGLLDIIQLDVTSDSLVSAAAAKLGETRKSIDVIVNNAGLRPGQIDDSILDLPLVHIQSAFETNVIGCARVARAFIPLLRRSGRPRILNVSSGLGSISKRNGPEDYAYAISKAALNMLTRSMAFELFPQGIITVAISPGWVRTDMGGSDATISAEESAQSLVLAIRTIGPEMNGQFLDRFGQPGKYAW
jgi:NAD(P)-dependent dehydrogenase (short-subunit alcohol dehydrogenase family)